jgi:hypothetical protein
MRIQLAVAHAGESGGDCGVDLVGQRLESRRAGWLVVPKDHVAANGWLGTPMSEESI